MVGVLLDIPTSCEWEIQLLSLQPDCPLALQLLLVLPWLYSSSGWKHYCLVVFICLSLVSHGAESFCGLVGHAGIFFGEMPDQSFLFFACFLNVWSCFLIAEFS